LRQESYRRVPKLHSGVAFQSTKKDVGNAMQDIDL